MVKYGLLLSWVMLSLWVPVTWSQGEVFEFSLEVVSPYEVPSQLRWDFMRGQAVACSETRDPNVQAYPSFSSDKPLFGCVYLPSGLRVLPTRASFQFVIDESEGTGTGYNRLFFDLNHDFDLTNESPLGTMEDSSVEGIIKEMFERKRPVCFEPLGVPCLYQETLRPIELMPRLDVTDDNDFYLCFMTTTARKGTISIAGRSFDVWLGHNRYMNGWFDQPYTALHLFPQGDFDKGLDWGACFMNNMHTIDGTLWRFTATPAGDTLRISPYQGAYGTLTVTDGNRRIGWALMNGVLCSTNTWVEVAGNRQRGNTKSSKKVHRCQIPVGDYIPSLEIDLGHLHLSTWANIHVDGHPHAHLNGPLTHFVEIREDRPFVLDFSNEAEVFFALPGENQCLHPGEPLKVQAVLHDPVLDMIFTDVSWKTRQFKLPESDEWFLGPLFEAMGMEKYWYQPVIVILFVVPGVLCLLLSVLIHKKRRLLWGLSAMLFGTLMIVSLLYYRAGLEWDYEKLNPTVTILRSDGEVVNSGVMPFG